MKWFSRFIWNAKRYARKESGQGMTEYIIIVALIAVAAIAVVVLFGDNIRKQFGKAANAVGGQKTADVTDTKAAESEQYQERDLADFGKAADAGLH
jgi:pilus assembly protein Flp/PilA